MHSEFTFFARCLWAVGFVRSKKAFVFSEFGDTCCNGTFLIPTVFRQKLDFGRPYLTAIQD